MEFIMISLITAVAMVLLIAWVIAEIIIDWRSPL